MTKDQVQDMIGQAMNTFAECRRQENEQFSLSMQNVITIQFFNLGVVLLQNLQQAQMSMLGVVASPAPHVVTPAPPAIVQPPPTTVEPTPPPPPPTQPSSPPQVQEWQ